MGDLKLGALVPAAIKVGTSTVSKIYQGSTQVYPVVISPVTQPVPGAMSSTSDVTNACGLTQDVAVWVNTADTTGETISIGDIVYTTNGFTSPFSGDSNYYKIGTAFGIVDISCQINSNGEVIGTSSIC